MAEKDPLHGYTLWNMPRELWKPLPQFNITPEALERIKEELAQERSEADEAQLRPYLTDNRQALADPRRY